MEILASTLDPQQTYKLMTGVIVPRPIAWITTLSEDGVVNLAPFSCFTFVSNKPPMVGINIGRKAGVRKDTGHNIHANGEFVVHVADEALLEPMHLSAIEHPADVSEAEVLGLQTRPSDQVRVPRLTAAPVSMECVLRQIIPFGDTGAEFYVGEVLVFHVRDELYENGKIETARLKPVCRLGGPNYSKLGEIVHMTPLAQTKKTVFR